MTDDLTALTATDAATLLESGDLTSEQLTTAYLERIAERDPLVHAWCHVDQELSLAAAKEADRSPRRSRLHGIPYGVKDVIDTVDFPTTYGSTIFAGHRPAADAACVVTMRAAGAVPVGKLVTTEFAVYSPNDTRNPVDQRYTPGGSSSGTGAAIGDRQIPVAFGNQTAGSLIRPAAYCGAHALKPTQGLVDQSGILPLEPLFDTLGYMGQSVPDLQTFFEVISGIAAETWPADRVPTVGLFHTPMWNDAQPEARHALLETGRRLSEAGVRVEEVDLPVDYRSLIDLHTRTLNQGLFRSLGDIHRQHRDRMSSTLLEMIDDGARSTEEQYEENRTTIRRRRDELNPLFGPFDAILTPSAPGEAPLGTATGSPVFQVGWSLLGAPCLNLPVATGPNGLPVGVQLIGRRHDDARLIGLAAELASRLGSVRFSAVTPETSA